MKALDKLVSNIVNPSSIQKQGKAAMEALYSIVAELVNPK